MRRSEAYAYRHKIEHSAEQLNDEDALQSIELFHPWSNDEDVAKGVRRKDLNADGELTLYECIQAYHTQDSWRPYLTPSLWKVVSIDEYPEWIMPHGSEDAYHLGDKVSHNDKHWVSIFDGANIWEPGVYGWEEVTE